ncbi:MAG: YbjN domain-containing protein [Coriobacteriales bacterium]|jgi:hypothetical protein
MTTAATQAISFEHALDGNEIKYTRNDDLPQPVFIIDFGGGDFTYQHLSVRVFFDDDGNSVHVLTAPIANIPEERIPRMLEVLNDLHNRFRWIRFYIDGDNDLVADTDIIIDDVTAGDMCVEIVMRTASVIDDAYADIMRAVWA